MNKKLIIILIIFLAIPLILVSNSLKPLKTLQSDQNDSLVSTNSDLIVVGFSQLGSESDWRTANTKSIQNSLTEENGFSLIFINGRQKKENQIKAVRSFIFQEVDYIAIAPVTENGWDTVLEEAKEADIPVIIVDRMIETKDESLYVTKVVTDKYEEGAKAGRWLEQHLNKEKESNNSDETENNLEETTVNNKKEHNLDVVNIVVLEGTLNSTAQIGRSKGFNDIAKQHENWNILAQESGDFTKAKGKEVMAEYLENFEDIDVLVSQNDDMTFGAIEAIHEAGRTCGINGDITVISFDAVSEAFDKMEEGLINVDIECNPLQGPIIAQVINDLEDGKNIDKVYYVEGEVFEAEDAKNDRIGRIY